MSVEETFGGAAGDLALTQVGFIFGGGTLIIGGIILGFMALFAETPEDFVIAKSENRNIQCQGLFKDYLVSSDKYKIVGDRVEIIRLIKNKSFAIGDCDIKG